MINNSNMNRILGQMAAIGTTVLLLAACSSTGTTSSQNTVRGSIETAPTDLQLLCASETASRLGLASDAVLPISSETQGTGSFLVILHIPSGQAQCIISADGAVQSVSRI
jgi:hypothetical protein